MTTQNLRLTWCPSNPSPDLQSPHKAGATQVGGTGWEDGSTGTRTQGTEVVALYPTVRISGQPGLDRLRMFQFSL